MNKILLFVACLLLQNIGFGQEKKDVKEQFNSFDIGFSYGYYFPAGDFGNRYGNSLIPQVSFNFFRANKGIQFGFNAGLLTGPQVKVKIFDPLVNNVGVVIADNGFPADIVTSLRGLKFGLHGSKIFKSFKSNESFIYLGLGAGVLQHNIRIVVNDAFVPQYSGDYAKGFDRNSRGPYIEEVVGYKIRKRRLKLDLDLVATQGFTKDLRIINFDDRSLNDGRNLDIIIGGRVTYYLSFLKATEGKDIYY